MTFDEKLIAELRTCIDANDINIELMERCTRAIARLVRQKLATQDLIVAANAMFDSTGVTIEMRDALKRYDNRKRPMVDWVANRKEGTDAERRLRKL